MEILEASSLKSTQSASVEKFHNQIISASLSLSQSARSSRDDVATNMVNEASRHQDDLMRIED
jgi:hypothetical protein